MNKADLMSKLSTIRNGVNFPITYRSDKTPNIASQFRNQYSLVKETSTYVRKGIKYDNLKKVKELRSNGNLPATNDGLKGKVWQVLNLILANTQGTKEYLRLYPSTFKNTKHSTTYYLNGSPISFNDLRAMGIMQPSFFNSTPAPLCYDINIDGIVSVGK